MKSLCMTAALVGLGLCGCQKTTTEGPAPATVSNPPATTTPATSNANDPKKLTLMAMESQTVKQGDTDDVLVTINRDNFNDAVSVSINKLPTGVTLDGPATIAASDNTVTLKLKATETALVGEHPVELVAEAPGIEKNVQTFTLNVTAK